ncbi:MAG: GNAT family N-acetyltransferase [Bauldia sp.]
MTPKPRPEVTIAIETALQDDVRELVALLNDYLLPLSPVEFQFKMTVEQMAQPDTTVFVARDGSGRAVGIGVLKLLPSAGEAEVKRMYTRLEVRGQRVGSAILQAIEGLARERGLRRLLLETGHNLDDGHRLYERSGFTRRGVFADYPDSAWSRFYEKSIA